MLEPTKTVNGLRVTRASAIGPKSSASISRPSCLDTVPTIRDSCRASLPGSARRGEEARAGAAVSPRMRNIQQRHGRSKGESPAQRFSFWPARAVRGLTRLCPRKSGDGLAAATDLHRSFPGTSAPSRKRGLRRRRPSRAQRAGRRDAGAAGKSAAGARNCLETARGRATLRARRSSLRSTMNPRPETRCCGRKAGVRGALPEAAGEITP